MSQPSSAPSSGYWYPGGGERATSVDILNLLRAYRETESKMRARTRASMRMNENDLVALRFLLQQERRGELVLQKDLVSRLGISSASVTGLVDRLVKSGHVERRSHPSDRRAVIIVPTVDTDKEVRATLGLMHQRMLAAADRLDADQLDGVALFLTGLIDAIEESEQQAEHAPPAP